MIHSDGRPTISNHGSERVLDKGDHPANLTGAEPPANPLRTYAALGLMRRNGDGTYSLTEKGERHFAEPRNL